MTKMTENGISVCPAGEERYEYFFPANFNRNKKRLCHYDYRTSDGELFSCIAPSLEECRKKRDKWMKTDKKMKTNEVNPTIIGRRCLAMFAGEMTPGIIKEINITKYGAHVKVLFDDPQRWHDSLFYSDWVIGYKEDESGSLKFLTLSEENETSPYETILVTFAEPILNLDAFFDDPDDGGTYTLKGWIDSYESSRFTQTGPQTAVITSEYNMKSVREWLERNMPIVEITEI